MERPNDQDHRIRGLGFNAVLVAVASLFWLLIRSGAKPSRLAYPCQQAALANSTALLTAGMLLLAHRLARIFHRSLRTRIQRALGVFFIVLALVGSVGSAPGRWRRSAGAAGPVGLLQTDARGRDVFLTAPAAMQLPSAHRVVSVRDPLATSWDFSCTGSGPCPVYYGDDEYVDQAVVDRMVAEGLERLTGATTVAAAWQVLMPDFVPGRTVAVKLNFNDSIMGGGASGYGDNDAYVDALPQVVNSLVEGLKSFGFLEDEIWLFDASRYLTDRFRSGIHYSGVRYVDRNGNGADVEAATFVQGVGVDFTASGYPGSHTIADVLVEADYIVNMPIMKRHGGAGITLGLKNHLGSIDGFYSGGHAMHDYFYLSGSHYDPAVNPMVDINMSPSIRDKTVLVVGDALYGAWPDNNEPPSRWSSFGDDSPNMLFFGVDPVATDSVMDDWLRREGGFSTAADDVLAVAAASGLGVYEHWNNGDDREYQVIDYVEIDLGGALFADGFEDGTTWEWSATSP